MIGSLTCKFDKALTDREGNIVVSFIVPKEKRMAAYALCSTLNDIPLRLDLYKDAPIRTITSNAYFHFLAQKISEKMRIGDDDAKKWLVLSYGTPHKDENGETLSVKVHKDANINTVHPYAKWYEDIEEGGEVYSCYMLYKPTHLLDRSEMSRLVEGAVYEAKELGIETLDDKKIKSLIERWDAKEE